jgi:hypothetical protein
MKPYYIMQDDGEKFLIPAHLKDEFNIIIEAIDNSEEDSDEWYGLIDRFNSKFWQYKIDGSLSKILFYLDEPDN